MKLVKYKKIIQLKIKIKEAFTTIFKFTVINMEAIWLSRVLNFETLQRLLLFFLSSFFSTAHIGWKDVQARYYFIWINLKHP